ncbi:MAG: hypothetical protein EZS28_054414, partial [Streblomastix strix]
LKDHITMTYRLLSADSLTGSVKIMKFGSSKTAFSFQDPFLIIAYSDNQFMTPFVECASKFMQELSFFIFGPKSYSNRINQNQLRENKRQIHRIVSVYQHLLTTISQSNSKNIPKLLTFICDLSKESDCINELE